LDKVDSLVVTGAIFNKPIRLALKTFFFNSEQTDCNPTPQLPLANSIASRPPDRHVVDLGYVPNLIELPPPEVMDEIANLYFVHCHNQPYSVFHEQAFKMKLQAGVVEPQVQYCMLGMAVRCAPPPIKHMLTDKIL
jgi:hypothetical protein